MKTNTSQTLNIGEGHELDLIKTINPTDEDFTTYWGKQPFLVSAKKERTLLRFIAVKFARELADKIIGEKAHSEDKKVIYYLPERINILNSILIKVTERYGQPINTPQEQVLAKGETALDIGRRNILNELGIPDKPPISNSKDVAANIVQKTLSPMEVKKQKDKLIAKAKVLKISVNKKWSLERIKKTILEA